jgi:hypothetical protein
VPGGLEVSSGELSWAVSNILIPLNQVLRDSASTNTWTFVDGIFEATDSHGSCAWAPYDPKSYSISHPVQDRTDEVTMRFFRRELEASIIQNDVIDKVTGTLHPNEYGHKAVKKRLLQVVTLPVVKDYDLNVDFFLSNGGLQEYRQP